MKPRLAASLLQPRSVPMTMRFSSAAAICLLVISTVSLTTAYAQDESPQVQWIWHQAERSTGQQVSFRRKFSLAELPHQARWTGLAEYAFSTIYVNDRLVHESEPYSKVAAVDVAEYLRVGDNAILIVCNSVSGPAAVMGRLSWSDSTGSRELVTNASWQASTWSIDNKLAAFESDLPLWQEAISLGPVELYRYGLEQKPITISPADDYTQWKRAIGAGEGTDPAMIEVPPGFKIERIHSATADQDSWVSLAADPAGGWIIGKEKQGLLRLTVDADDGQVHVTEINDTLKECRGIVFHNGWLYAMANNDKALYRLRDTGGNGNYESVEKLMEFAGDVGHGRNQLTLGPDGKLYGIFGDSVFEPTDLKALPPKIAHASTAEQERSGFVVRFEDELSKSTVLVRGLRNPYGLAFNDRGDMFTYDADAEYDMGASWYRPTRVEHLLPGGDYRWRRVTKQWPAYFPDQADMPQSTLDIGKGSPTAVVFGSGKNFPPRYRNALFVLDWAYGRIVAVHLTPRGSSYYGAPETFLRGQPLNVTDCEFGPDGAMYFTTGGRGTQSALYRVTYVGGVLDSTSTTEQQLACNEHAEAATRIRRQLNAMHAGVNDRNLDFIWQHLSNDDPWIRHAARTALESLPTSMWQQRIDGEADIDTWLAARMALVRTADNPPVDSMAQAILEGKFSPSTQRQRLEMLFLCELLLDGRFELREGLRDKLYEQLRQQYPADSWEVNRHLSLLLSAAADDSFASTTVHLLDRAADQAQQFHFMYVLRNVTAGWSPELRRGYFAHLQWLNDFIGGEGMPDFRRLIRNESLAAVPEAERTEYAALLKHDAPKWLEEIPQENRELVKKWQVADFDSDVLAIGSDRDLTNGRKVFAAAACIRCHRVGNRGDVSGPDLTAVSRRFSPREVLVSVLEPSKVVAEKYASHRIELTDGRVLTGRIAAGDYRAPDLEIVPNLLEPTKLERFAKAEIASQSLSPVSPMPSGLLDTFTREEILDLLAYLVHGET